MLRLLRRVWGWPSFAMVTQKCRFPRRTSPTSNGLLVGLPDEGFTPRVDTYGAKGVPLSYTTTRRPRTGWVTMYHLWRYGRVLGPKWWAWRFSLSIREWWIGFRALRRIRSAIFSDSARWTRDRIPANGEFMSAKWNQRGPPCALHRFIFRRCTQGTRWSPFGGVGQAKFSFLGVKLAAKKAGRKEEDKSRGGGGRI